MKKEVTIAYNKVDLKILTTSLLAWIVLTFSILKLIVIYVANPLLTYLTTYNFTSLLFLLYLLSYFGFRFRYKLFLTIVTFYNLGILFCDFMYDKVILLESVKFGVVRNIFFLIINYIFLHISYFIALKIKEIRKR